MHRRCGHIARIARSPDKGRRKAGDRRAIGPCADGRDPVLTVGVDKGQIPCRPLIAIFLTRKADGLRRHSQWQLPELAAPLFRRQTGIQLALGLIHRRCGLGFGQRRGRGADAGRQDERKDKRQNRQSSGHQQKPKTTTARQGYHSFRKPGGFLALQRCPDPPQHPCKGAHGHPHAPLFCQTRRSAYLIAAFSLSARSVRSHEKPPSFSGARPKWP